MDDRITDTRNRKTAFTLAEVLVALVVIGILATLGVGSYWKARDTAWREKTRDTAHQLAIAWNMRLVDDGQFPAPSMFDNTIVPKIPLANSGNVQQQLSGPYSWSDGNGNSGKAQIFASTVPNMAQVCVSSNNVQRRIYFEQSAAARTNGLLDHWGNYFYVALDTSYIGTIASPTNTATVIHANVLVWSTGKTPSNPSSWIVAGQ